MADNWADYLISGVRYAETEDRRFISQVIAHPDNGDSVGPGSAWTRADVIGYIDKGYLFCTIIKADDGRWNKGAKVDKVDINGAYYIKTAANSKEEDNLGDLPEF